MRLSKVIQRLKKKKKEGLEIPSCPLLRNKDKHHGFKDATIRKEHV